MIDANEARSKSLGVLMNGALCSKIVADIESGINSKIKCGEFEYTHDMECVENSRLYRAIVHHFQTLGYHCWDSTMGKKLIISW